MNDDSVDVTWFLTNLAEHLARVEHSQDVELLDAEAWVEAFTAAPDVPEIWKACFGTFLAAYAMTQEEIVYEDEFSSLLAFNEMEAGNETD